MKKMYVVMLAGMLACGSLFAGCGSTQAEDAQSTNVDNTDRDDTFIEDVANEPSDDGGDDGDDGSGFMDDISNALQANGRDYGETHELSQNDVMHSIFFDLQVNSVETVYELEEWLPADGCKFIVVNVSIKNTFNQDDPMSYADFPIYWNTGADGEWAYPDLDFSTSLPEEYNISVGQTVTGDLIYMIPDDINEIVMEYYDLWSDEFEGDTFDMHIMVD